MRPLFLALVATRGCSTFSVGVPADLHDAAVSRAIADLDYRTSVPWLPWSEALMEGLQTQLVVVFVSADYDLTAKVIEREVFADAAVRRCLDDLDAAPVLLDATHPSPEQRGWLTARDLFEPHLYVVPPDGARPYPLFPVDRESMRRSLGCRVG